MAATPMPFRAVVELGGKTATGLEVPAEIVTALDAGRRPAVVVTVAGHSYRSTIAVRGGRFLVPLSAENRTAAGVAAGDEVDVTITLDTAPRTVELPAELTEAFAADPGLGEFFAGLAPTNRKEWVRWIEEAKRPETRSARVAKTIDALRERRPAR